MRNSEANPLALIMLLTAALIPCGCFQWRYNVTEMGVAFNRVRVEDDGLVIGELAKDTLIGGRPCRQGWVHIYVNGVPAGFTASRDLDLGRLKIPAATWVFQGEDGVVTVCAFPRDLEVQGHLCRGSGGPKGVEAAFYPDGALKQYFLCRDTRIQGIPCMAGSRMETIMLHENGQLKRCVLSEDIVRGGRTYAKGTLLRFNSDGRIVH